MRLNGMRLNGMGWGGMARDGMDEMRWFEKYGMEWTGMLKLNTVRIAPHSNTDSWVRWELARDTTRQTLRFVAMCAAMRCDATE